MTDKQIIIDEAKNSKLDLKSFLVGEAVQNEYEQQLDQLKAEIKELKRKNARKRTGLKKKQSLISQLKAENDELKRELLQFDKDVKDLNYFAMKFKNCLTEIKEIAENAYCLTNATNKDMAQFAKQILQKISEVNNDMENN